VALRPIDQSSQGRTHAVHPVAVPQGLSAAYHLRHVVDADGSDTARDDVSLPGRRGGPREESKADELLAAFVPAPLCFHLVPGTKSPDVMCVYQGRDGELRRT
jgi:hypothetical protein